MKIEVSNACVSPIILAEGPFVTTSVRAVVNAGALQDTRAGSAHFLEHMAFKGTSKKSAKEIAFELAALGSGNAYTSWKRTVFTVDTVPASMGRAFELLNEIITDSEIDADELYKERGPIREERVMRAAQPITYWIDEADRLLFPNCGSRSRSMIGEVEDIDSMTRDDLVAFQKQNYRDANVAWIVVGPDVMRMWPEIEALVSSFHVGTGSQSLQGDHWPSLTPAKTPVHDLEHPTDQSVVGIAMYAPSESDDHHAGYPHGTAIQALGGGMYSLLFQRIREERGLAYATGAFSSDDRYSMAYALCTRANAEEVQKRMVGAIEDMAEGKLPEKTLRATEQNFKYGVLSSMQTPDGMARAGLDAYFDHPGDTSYMTPARISEILDSREDVAAMVKDAARTWASNGSVIIRMNAGQA